MEEEAKGKGKGCEFDQRQGVYECEYCLTKFTIKGNLWKHTKNDHPEVAEAAIE